MEDALVVCLVHGVEDALVKVASTLMEVKSCLVGFVRVGLEKHSCGARHDTFPTLQSLLEGLGCCLDDLDCLLLLLCDGLLLLHKGLRLLRLLHEGGERRLEVV